MNTNNTQVMNFLNRDVVSRTVQFTMQKILEKWGNVKLYDKLWYMYGIRRYTRGLFVFQVFFLFLASGSANLEN